MRSLAWLLKKAKSYCCGQIVINSIVLVQLFRVRFQRSAYDPSAYDGLMIKAACDPAYDAYDPVMQFY